MAFDLASHIAGLARVRVAAGVLFRDAEGRVLLVRPTYKPGWEIPGGSVEPDESPLAAARREIMEELGTAFPIGRLLAVDWVPPAPPWDGGLMFLFDGGPLTTDQIAAIRLPPDELDGYLFAGPDELAGLLTPRVARRLSRSLTTSGALYLESGAPPD